MAVALLCRRALRKPAGIILASTAVSLFAYNGYGSTSGGHYRMLLFLVAVTLAFLALIYVAYHNPLDASFGRPSLIATVLIMVVAAIYYLLVLARRAKWTLHGPDELAD